MIMIRLFLICKIILLSVLLLNCSSEYDEISANRYTSIENMSLKEMQELNRYKNISADNYTQAQEEIKQDVENQNSSKNKDQNITNQDKTIREVALYEIAMSFGMRAGLYARSKDINQYLSEHKSILDHIFDFRSLMLDNNIMPPVLIEARKTMTAESHQELPSDDDSFLLNNNPVGKSLVKANVRVEHAQNDFRTLRITDRIYKIIRQARFAITVPSWNDYIRLSYSAPGIPEKSLLPRNDEEQKSWSEGVQKGWDLGLAQADQILNQNLRLLKRDYLGMIRYRRLLSKNMVSEPYVAKRNYGVTGDGDEIKIHDRVLTIAALPALKPDSGSWTPFLTQNEEQELEAKLAMLDIDKMLKYLNNGKGLINQQMLYKK